MAEPCPGCGLLDQVQHVPAVYYGGHAYFRGRSPSVAVPSGDGVVFTGGGEVSGVSVSAVARALDPFPRRRRAGGFVAAAILLALVGGCLLLLPFSGSPPPGGTVGLVVVSLPAVCVFGAVVTLGWLAVRRSREHRQRLAGVPAAQAVWERGWFCHRCGGVYLPGGPLVSPAEFRELVARAGGY